MSSFKIDLRPEDAGGSIRITQGIGDLKAALKYGDFSRLSAYRGNDVGVHTGSNSPTLGRHGQPFGEKK